jgi:hypothetical protein
VALKIVTGGTTGAADGTLVSSGNKLTFTALNTPIDAHIRADDGYWTSDEDFTVPAEVEVSFDGGSTWFDSGDNPITVPEIEDVNSAVKFRQVTGVASTSDELVSGLSVTYNAITALADVSSFTATPDTGQITLAWAAISNESGFTIERSTNGGSTYSALTTKAADSTSHVDTGLTDGNTYHYRIKATGTGRYSNSANWVTANATAGWGTLIDGFEGGSDGASLSTPWTLSGSTGTATYTTTQAKIGSQSGKISSGAVARAIAETTSAGAKTEIRFWHRQSSNSLGTLALYDGSGASSTTFFVDWHASGNMRCYVETGGIAASPYDTSGYKNIDTYSADTWTQYRITLDYTAKTYKVYRRSAVGDAWTQIGASGSTIGIPFRGQSATAIAGTTFSAAQATGSIDAFVDDVRVS